MFCVFPYNAFLLFYVQLTRPAQLVSVQGEKAKGPGFDPQVPIFANVIFFYIIRYTCVQRDHHMPSSFNQQISSKLDPRAILGRSMMHSSQANAQDLESQHGPRIFGLKSQINTPLFATNIRPISLFFFSISLFNSF